MKLYFLGTGSFCFIYYAWIYYYTHRWNSTFAGFWIFSGAVHFMLGIREILFGASEVINVFTAAVWVVFVAVEIRICLEMWKKPQQKLAYLIVLGAQVRGKSVTDSLRRRLDTAGEYLKRNRNTIVIVSGGKGKGEEITEAEAMAEYLKKIGIEEKRIFQEDRSTTTRENLKFSRAYISDVSEQVGIVTNNFHVYRAVLLGKKLGYRNVCGLAAGCNRILFLNYMVREFFALLSIHIGRNRRMGLT